jgi:hypothetical protein
MKQLSLLAILTTASSLASAQPDPAPDATPPALEAPPAIHAERPAVDEGKRFTVMWAPLRLIIPLVELTVEYRVRDQLGIVATIGAGRRTIEIGGTQVAGTELEAGLQVRYYVLRAFSGLHLGAEVLDEYVTFDEPLPPNVLGAAAGGVTAGAFVGYKVLTRIGFTFEAQLGARYLVIDPPATGMSPGRLEERWLPLLHLNVGWTF